MKVIDIIAIVLLLIGGLNWGLIGLFEFNLVETIFGHFPVLVRIIYALVGLSAVYKIIKCKSCCDQSSCHK